MIVISGFDRKNVPGSRMWLLYVQWKVPHSEEQFNSKGPFFSLENFGQFPLNWKRAFYFKIPLNPGDIF